MVIQPESNHIKGSRMSNLALAPVDGTETPADTSTKVNWKFVTHLQPDTDALLCIWAAQRFIAKPEDERDFAFVASGENLPAEEAEGYTVLTMDTGRGELDQHEKNLERSSSFVLLCEKYGLVNDYAMQPLIELSRATDNVEKVDFTSIHFVLKGLWYYYRDPKSKEVDWSAVVNSAFTILDVLYNQASSREAAHKMFEKVGKVEDLPSGNKISVLMGQPRLRDAAFEAGAQIVLFTHMVDKKNGTFGVCIQVNKRRFKANLAPLMTGLRALEASKRGVAIDGRTDLGSTGAMPEFGGWYFHDSGNLILCGSRTHQLQEGEHTKLSVDELLSVFRKRANQILVTPIK